MTAESAIEVHDVSYVYSLALHGARSLKELASTSLFRLGARRDVTALAGVDFRVGRGEIFAVIGANGAGKSTLMKLLARVLPPAAGRVVVRGRTSPMIELGAGFHPDQTGRENILFYGNLLGRTTAHMRERSIGIAEWAGLRDYLDVPLRAYSSGMVARLAFAVAADVDPDVLLLDEVLAVGDEEFRQRSVERMNQLIHGGAAVVMVTHGLEEVIKRADRAMLLVDGKMAATGSPRQVVDAYHASLTHSEESA